MQEKSGRFTIAKLDDEDLRENLSRADGSAAFPGDRAAGFNHGGGRLCLYFPHATTARTADMVIYGTPSGGKSGEGEKSWWTHLVLYVDRPVGTMTIQIAQNLQNLAGEVGLYIRNAPLPVFCEESIAPFFKPGGNHSIRSLQRGSILSVVSGRKRKRFFAGIDGKPCSMKRGIINTHSDTIRWRSQLGSSVCIQQGAGFESFASLLIFSIPGSFRARFGINDYQGFRRARSNVQVSFFPFSLSFLPLSVVLRKGHFL
jgi:hypothetical protein